MRVGVIRNDLSAPIFLADLESVSQRNASNSPPGQERYISYATAATVAAALADTETGSGASVVGTAITFPLTINGTNNRLEIRTGSGSAPLVPYTIAQATYADRAALLAALTTAFGPKPAVRAFAGSIATGIVVESTAHGVDSVIQVGSSGTAQTALGLATTLRTMPAASAYITAIGLPGALNVSAATLNAVGATTATNALVGIPAPRGAAAVAEAVAPQFAETDIAMESFLKGNLSKFRSATFKPADKAAGAAVAVVENDGTTAFATGNTVPTLATAAWSTGSLLLTGTGLGGENGGSTSPLRSTLVVLTLGTKKWVFEQELIERKGGTVTETGITIPAAAGILPASGAGYTVRVQFRQMASNTLSVA